MNTLEHFHIPFFVAWGKQKYSAALYKPLLLRRSYQPFFFFRDLPLQFQQNSKKKCQCEKAPLRCMHHHTHASTLFRLQSICIVRKHMIYTKLPFACLFFFPDFTKNIKNGEETAQNNNPLSIIPPNMYHISQQALTRSNKSLKGISKFPERTVSAQYILQEHHASKLDFNMHIHLRSGLTKEFSVHSQYQLYSNSSIENLPYVLNKEYL